MGPPRLYADDNGGDGNTLDARDANRMTVLRSTHSRVAGSNPPAGIIPVFEMGIAVVDARSSPGDGRWGQSSLVTHMVPFIGEEDWSRESMIPFLGAALSISSSS